MAQSVFGGASRKGGSKIAIRLPRSGFRIAPGKALSCEGGPAPFDPPEKNVCFGKVVHFFLTCMREERVNCRLSPEEQQKLGVFAREAAMKPSTLLRCAAFAYLEQRFLLPPHLEDLLLRLLQESRRIGTNLNQLAAKANTLQRATGGDLRTARRLVGNFEDRLRELDDLLRSLRPRA